MPMLLSVQSTFYTKADKFVKFVKIKSNKIAIYIKNIFLYISDSKVSKFCRRKNDNKCKL